MSPSMDYISEFCIILMSDRSKLGDKKMINDYGVWGEKNMYGKVSMGIIRSTFLIDKDGVLIKKWTNVKAKGHAEKVKAELQKI